MFDVLLPGGGQPGPPAWRHDAPAGQARRHRGARQQEGPQPHGQHGLPGSPFCKKAARYLGLACRAHRTYRDQVTLKAVATALYHAFNFSRSQH